jgi:hypothetical protein
MPKPITPTITSPIDIIFNAVAGSLNHKIPTKLERANAKRLTSQ